MVRVRAGTNRVLRVTCGFGGTTGFEAHPAHSINSRRIGGFIVSSFSPTVARTPCKRSWPWVSWRTRGLASTFEQEKEC